MCAYLDKKNWFLYKFTLYFVDFVWKIAMMQILVFLSFQWCYLSRVVRQIKANKLVNSSPTLKNVIFLTPFAREGKYTVLHLCVCLSDCPSVPKHSVAYSQQLFIAGAWNFSTPLVRHAIEWDLFLYQLDVSLMFNDGCVYF